MASTARWPDVLEMAKRWRELTPADTMAADQMIAAAHVAMGNHAAACDQLAPHLQRALTDPKKFHSFIMQYATAKVAAGAIDEGANTLRPYLVDSLEWRREWLSLAVWVLDAPHATAWMTEIEPIVNRQNEGEQVEFARAWQMLAKRSGDATHAAKLTSVIERMTGAAERGQVSPASAVMLAYLHETRGEFPAAERLYRRALQLDPASTLAQNNLAMLLATKGERLDEALSLAQQAAKVESDDRASFLDTLAFVQAQRRDYPAAVQSIEQAITLRPNHPGFQTRLLTLLVDNNEIDRARPVLMNLKSLNPNDVTPELLQQIRALEDRIEKTKATSARAT
jgi:tetratricopeptide (TPR) repeat protein